MEKRYSESNQYKVYIEVFAHFNTDGRIMPFSFIWEDGRKYEIDKVLDVTRAASLKAGGLGTRYTCQVCGKKIYLYLDDGRWFIIRKYG